MHAPVGQRASHAADLAAHHRHGAQIRAVADGSGAIAHEGDFIRVRDEIVRPPEFIGDASIFPVRTPHRVPGVGAFPSEDDYDAFRDRVLRVPGLALAERLASRRRYLGNSGGRHRSAVPDLTVVIASPTWDRNGINAHSERLARGLSQLGIRATLLLTEEETDLIQVDVARLPVPTDLPFERLPVDRTAGWGRHWGAMVRFLESKRHCIYLPTYDYRHAAIVPLLSNEVGVVNIPTTGDAISMEQMKRLLDYWDEVVVALAGMRRSSPTRCRSSVVGSR